VLRFMLWRLLGLLAALLGFAAIAWLLGGGPGRALRGSALAGGLGSSIAALMRGAARRADAAAAGLTGAGGWIGWAPLALALVLAVVAAGWRWRVRRQRTYMRLYVDAYRTDRAAAQAVVAMFEALHKRLLRRWWRRVLAGQPAVTLEIHHSCAPPPARAWLAVC